MIKANKLIIFMFMILATVHSVQAGNLFSDSTYKPLTIDHVAHNIGDVITVLIYEEATAKASTKADTSTQENVGISTNDGITGKNKSLGLNNAYDGKGSLNREGQLIARVSAVVTKVYDNGDLLISADQKIEFNSEAQNITLKGRVREQDISQDNTVISTRLANADIKYIGEGILSDREKPGLLTRFFNWLF